MLLNSKWAMMYSMVLVSSFLASFLLTTYRILGRDLFQVVRCELLFRMTKHRIWKSKDLRIPQAP
jgi:hypothetical protein